MKSIVALAFLTLALSGIAGSALAGEDSTHRWHGVGPAFYEVRGGLKRFAEGDPSEPPLKRSREGESRESCRR